VHSIDGLLMVRRDLIVSGKIAEKAMFLDCNKLVFMNIISLVMSVNEII
jgi:hypothetical protein